MIRAAVIGLGWWGKTLVRGAKASGRIEIVAGATGRRELVEDVAREQGFALRDSFEEVLADPAVQAVILATPHLEHEAQVIAAARAGKHVFCEKPFTLSKDSAERAVAAVNEAGVTLGLGHNRRFHPNIVELRRRQREGELGTILHGEGTMTAPNGLFLKPESWRVDPRQSPAGGMAGLGIHMVDGLIDLLGPIEAVAAQSLHRAVPTGAEDTTSILLRFRDGPTGYVSCMTATAPTYRLCLYGTKGVAEVRGREHDQFTFWPTPDAPLGGHAGPKPAETSSISGFDTVAAELLAFAEAVEGGRPFPIAPEEMVHGIAAYEAIVRSAAARGDWVNVA